jgi:hypothetical protein
MKMEARYGMKRQRKLQVNTTKLAKTSALKEIWRVTCRREKKNKFKEGACLKNTNTTSWG